MCLVNKLAARATDANHQESVSFLNPDPMGHLDPQNHKIRWELQDGAVFFVIFVLAWRTLSRHSSHLMQAPTDPFGLGRFFGRVISSIEDPLLVSTCPVRQGGLESGCRRSSPWGGVSGGVGIRFGSSLPPAISSRSGGISGSAGTCSRDGSNRGGAAGPRGVANMLPAAESSADMVASATTSSSLSRNFWVARLTFLWKFS